MSPFDQFTTRSIVQSLAYRNLLREVEQMKVEDAGKAEREIQERIVLTFLMVLLRVLPDFDVLEKFVRGMSLMASLFADKDDGTSGKQG